MNLSRLDYVTCIRGDDPAAAVDALEGVGATVVVLDGSGVRDGRSLFAAVGEQLGLDESMHPGGWDGLADALFEVVTRGGASPVVIVWDHADVLLEADLQDLLTAASVFENVAVSSRRSSEVDSYLVLLGATEAFRPLSAYDA